MVRDFEQLLLLKTSELKMILLALKSLFFVTAILGYSTGVWRLIGNYFQQEFKTYLAEEGKKNRYLLVDPVVENPPAATVEIVTETEVRQAGRSVTANRLLDEMIVNFGRLFTTRNEAEFSRTKTPAGPRPDRPTEEIVASTSRQVRRESRADLDLGGKLVAAGAIIESDKFPRSYSSEVDNESDENDVASDGDDGDEEEKWIKYWKNRERGNAAEGDGEGHCEAKLDACGP